MFRNCLTCIPRRIFLVTALLGIAVPLGIGEIRDMGLRRPETTSVRTVGIVNEVLLPSGLVTAASGPPRPAAIRALDEMEGIQLPNWLPPDVQSAPVAQSRALVTGERVTWIRVQVMRSGETLPVVIIQLENASSDNRLKYAPAPRVPEELECGLAAMLTDEVYDGPIDDTRVTGSRDIQLASYGTTSIDGHRAETISIPPTDRPALHGILWQAGSTYFYVGGRLPPDEIRAIAEGLMSS